MRQHAYIYVKHSELVSLQLRFEGLMMDESNMRKAFLRFNLVWGKTSSIKQEQNVGVNRLILKNSRL